MTFIQLLSLLLDLNIVVASELLETSIIIIKQTFVVSLKPNKEFLEERAPKDFAPIQKIKGCS